jgi:hypothetical protein
MPLQPTFQVFAIREAREYLEERKSTIKTRIESESDEYVLNVNKDDYVAHLTQEFRLDPPQLDFSRVEADFYEKEVPSHPYLTGSSRVKRMVVVYRIPCQGDSESLTLKPNQYIPWTMDVHLDGPNLCFEIVARTADGSDVKREAEKVMRDLKTQHGHLVAQLEDFNGNLSAIVGGLLEERKQALSRRKAVLESLGVPVRRRSNIPATFEVPFPTRKAPLLPKPTAKRAPDKPEPVLDPAIYEDILKVIHDFGKQLERMPSTYRDKTEPELRDILLILLEPRYEGISATGETFNKSGKTDILVRFEKSNVFIAECTFWRGAKAFLDKTTQLLRYLTWRDSKAALVVFVRNREFTSVLAGIEEAVPKHPCFVSLASKREETWFDFKMHLESDKDRVIHLAVLAFHLPP